MLTAEVTVKVLNLGSIALVCASPPLVYEGSEDYRFGLLGVRGLRAMLRSIRIRLDSPGKIRQTRHLLIAGCGRSRPDIRRAGGSGRGRNVRVPA